jgi:methionyl-tRNA synthetase
MLYNTELANNLGNLCNRSLNMTKRYRKGIVARTDHDDDECRALRDSFGTCLAAYTEAMESFETDAALGALRTHLDDCNAFAERTKPWELAKDESQSECLDAVLAHMLETVAHTAVLLSPILPEAAAKIFHQLRAPDLAGLRLPDLKWGLLPDGHQTGKPKPVFPRIEIPEGE